MKKYRPLNAGYILVYVVVIAVIVQGIWTLIAMMLRQGAQAQNSLYGMLDMWTLILVPFAVIYGNHYRQTVVELSSTAMRIVRPAVVYPKEGLGYGIDGLVIPTGAKHVDAAHQFLDYLMRPEVAANNAEMQYYMCVNQAAREYLSDTYREASVMNVPAELLKDAEFIEDVGATETLYQEIYTAFKNQ